jgi:hypothetical protein
LPSEVSFNPSFPAAEAQPRQFGIRHNGPRLQQVPRCVSALQRDPLRPG